jgi:polysaccharide deacetylase family protein (PEP-CTERM system associated)
MSADEHERNSPNDYHHSAGIDLRNKNFLTFDIEEWYHVNYEGIDASTLHTKETNLEFLVDRLIDLCSLNEVRTTCFILGSVGRDKPFIVRKLHAAGHEIASHGYGHRSVYPMKPSEFQDDLRVSCDILEDITGEKVFGFRAPSFSVKRETLQWYYAVLEDAGLSYSSSVFPGKTFLYGIPDFPALPHYPVVNGTSQQIFEFPLPRLKLFGTDVGLYFRLFPAAMITRKIRKDNRLGRSVVLYVHPREIDVDQPRLPLRFGERIIHYWGIRSCEKKLVTVIRSMKGRLYRFRDVIPSLWEKNPPSRSGS